MPQPPSPPRRPPSPRKLPLRLILIVPFVLQVMGAVGLVGYLSFKNSQQDLEDLADQLSDRTSQQVQQELVRYLEIPRVMNQINVDALQLDQLDPQNLERFPRVFWRQRSLFDPSASAVYFGRADGEFVGLGFQSDETWQIGRSGPQTQGKFNSYGVDDDGNPTELLSVGRDYDPRVRPWYQKAVEAGQQTWSNIYVDFKEARLKITLAQPIYEAGQLQGVIGVDFVLSHISDFLKRVNGTQSGRILIIERTGKLIASSIEMPTLDQKEQLNALESRDSVTQQAVQQLDDRYTLNEMNTIQRFGFHWQGDRYLTRVTPFNDPKGLNWLILVIVPESAFTERIEDNNRITLLLTLGTLALAIISGIITARWVTRPLYRLSVASQRIASGELDQQVTTGAIQEVSLLAESFNQMSREIQQSNLQLEDYARSLEQKVEDRTQALKLEICDREQAQVELQQAKEAAESANQAKSVFLAHMSHELRSPLNAILGFAQLLQRNPKPEQQENIQIIIRSGEHLLSLINNVLDLSKIEAGRITLEERDIELAPLLDEIQVLFQNRTQDKAVQFVCDRAPHLPAYIRTDPVKLRQILINLLSNAVKFTPAGSITLRVWEEGEGEKAKGERGKAKGEKVEPVHPSTHPPIHPSTPLLTANPNQAQRRRDAEADPTPHSPLPTPYSPHPPIPSTTLHFEIEDTGVGIAPEELTQLFQAFVQTQSGRDAQTGTGLGLSISQKFVRLLGGEISVASKLGRGSCFRFTVPVEVVEAIAPDPASLQGQVMGLEPGQPVYRILVVDDKATNRLLLSQLLQPVGFEVREASNGVEAIALWQSWQPHLIWMDMQMPVMNGSQATQHIKATSQGQDTTIIALTASALEEDRARVMAAGCDGFVRKPFQSGDIFATMQKCLGVRYLYDQSAPIQPWVNREALAETEGWLAHLDTLPSPWLNQLYQALLDGDLEWANDLIGQLKNQDSEQYGAIADHLQQRLHDFEYEQVLQWIASTMDCND